MKPYISAIIITWNRATYVRGAIQSVLDQTFSDFELLVLDNSSSDDTQNVVKRFSDKRIRYIRHEPLGISEARNLGVREARADIFGFLDDDDTWLPEKLERQTELFQASSPRVGMIYGGFHRVNERGVVYETFVPTLRGWGLEEYLCKRDPWPGSASNPLIRKEVFKSVGGYDEYLRTSEDWEFYLRLMRKFRIDFVPEPILNVRRHAGVRLGDRLREAAEAELKVCEEFRDVLEKRPSCHSFYLQAIGGKFCRLGEFEKGRSYLRRAITLSPMNYIAWAQYLLSFLGVQAYGRIHRFYKQWR